MVTIPNHPDFTDRQVGMGFADMINIFHVAHLFFVTGCLGGLLLHVNQRPPAELGVCGWPLEGAGATLFVRLKETHPNSSCNGFCEGLHIVTLAEVKWCQEVPNGEAFPYGVGVKYFETVY